ncbi:hypothetical protein CEUSTIGMA_g5145.t1 [Chlamydomonas eustigma]|uniref:E3 ubiquitin protein ligase n=1 Tax=Chlamydomonas eustigma TaxID=1157962 RepID=A0A250X483_9CHLO|nr:hypothetical protein CEUSTIGMA_g5145.t1 [Chlamydomonas eustigma]|eukprot:GAX77702.1 hypothetical protein CEUSTIGMA_g5145.t1 [Chlamydomonas eustigma]
MAEQRIQVLTHQNQQLAVQLEEKRRDTRILEDKLSEYESKEIGYAQTLMCVNRVWERLLADIQHLSAGCFISDPVAEVEAVQSTITMSDPFLARLLESCPPPVIKSINDNKKQIDASLSLVEEALVQRAMSTQDGLSRVLQSIKMLQDQNSQLSLRLASTCSNETLQEDMDRLVQEVASIRQRLHHNHALQRTTAERLQAAEDRSLQAEEHMKKLQNELADTEQQLSSLQRKYAALKDGKCAEPNNAVVIREASAGNLQGNVNTSGSENNSQPHAQDNLLDEIQCLRLEVQKREEELEKERGGHLDTKRELKVVQSKLDGEHWVTSTRTYQSVVQELTGVKEALTSRGKELEAVCKERDEAVQEAQVKNHYFHAETVMKQKVIGLEKAFMDLQLSKAESDRMRQELELHMLRERDKMGNVKTVDELKAMMATLQTQVASMQKLIELNKGTRETLVSCAEKVLEAEKLAGRKHLEAQRLTDRLRQKGEELDESRRREQGLKERVNDLKAFVDMLTIYCNDSRDATEVRASEAALKEKVATLESQLQGHSLQQRVLELESAERVARDQVELIEIESDCLRIEISRYRREAEELRTQLQASTSECQMYIAEIETTGAAYEEMQSQNTRMLSQLIERDEAHNALRAERLKITQSQQQLQELVDSRTQELHRLRAERLDQASYQEQLEKEVSRLASDLATLKEELRFQTARADTTVYDARRLEETVSNVQSQLEAGVKRLEHAETELRECQEKVLKEKTKRQKLEGENRLLHVKLERLRKNAGGGAVDKELQEEVEAMRHLLNCNVCHERRKNVIITKCCHVFCDKCIKRNLEARNRKCPGCGVQYGQADVKHLYLS